MFPLPCRACGRRGRLAAGLAADAASRVATAQIAPGGAPDSLHRRVEEPGGGTLGAVHRAVTLRASAREAYARAESRVEDRICLEQIHGVDPKRRRLSELQIALAVVVMDSMATTSVVNSQTSACVMVSPTSHWLPHLESLSQSSR